MSLGYRYPALSSMSDFRSHDRRINPKTVTDGHKNNHMSARSALQISWYVLFLSCMNENYSAYNTRLPFADFGHSFGRKIYARRDNYY